MDDFLLPARTEEELLIVSKMFLRRGRERRLKVSVVKSVFFTNSIPWCGRVIDEEGVQCDPFRLSGILDCDVPAFANELSKFVKCLQFMLKYISNFAAKVLPLRDLLEKAHKQSVKLTAKSIQKMQLSNLRWSQEHDQAYTDLKEQLCNTVKLAHRDKNKSLCMYSDTSERYWSAVIMQCNRKLLRMGTEDQQHQPSIFLGAVIS